jgi:hypothetical protein
LLSECRAFVDWLARGIMSDSLPTGMGMTGIAGVWHRSVFLEAGALTRLVEQGRHDAEG